MSVENLVSPNKLSDIFINAGATYFKFSSKISTQNGESYIEEYKLSAHVSPNSAGVQLVWEPPKANSYFAYRITLVGTTNEGNKKTLIYDYSNSQLASSLGMSGKFNLDLVHETTKINISNYNQNTLYFHIYGMLGGISGFGLNGVYDGSSCWTPKTHYTNDNGTNWIDISSKVKTDGLGYHNAQAGYYVNPYYNSPTYNDSERKQHQPNGSTKLGSSVKLTNLYDGTTGTVSSTVITDNSIKQRNADDGGWVIPINNFGVDSRQIIYHKNENNEEEENDTVYYDSLFFKVNNNMIEYDSDYSVRMSFNSNDYSREPAYTFLSWNTKADGSGTTYQTGSKFTSVADSNAGKGALHLYAQWQQNTTTISWNLNGGTAKGPTPTTVYIDSSIELPNIEKARHTFDGWKINSDTTLKAEKSTITISSASTITAIWTPYRKITFLNYGMFGEGESSFEIPNGTSLTSPTANRPGFEFTGWYDETKTQLSQNKTFSKEYTKDSTVTATWKEKNNQFIINLNGGNYNGITSTISKGGEELENLQFYGNLIPPTASIVKDIGGERFYLTGWKSNQPNSTNPHTIVSSNSAYDYYVDNEEKPETVTAQWTPIGNIFVKKDNKWNLGTAYIRKNNQWIRTYDIK